MSIKRWKYIYFFLPLYGIIHIEVMNMAIGDQIKKLRKQQHMTQKQLAKESGIAEITIRQYEAGKYMPKHDNLMKLANVFGVDITDIVEDYYQVGVNGRRDLGPILSKASIKTDKMDEVFLMNYYRQLNDLGKEEAHKRVGELTLLDAYKSITNQQQLNIKYNPNAPNDVYSINAFYDELRQQEKDIPKGKNTVIPPDEPPQE